MAASFVGNNATDGTPDVDCCCAVGSPNACPVRQRKIVSKCDQNPHCRLAEEKGVVCTPMSVFYASEIFARAPCTLVRFTVCKSREHIQRAVDQMLAD